MNSPWPEVTDHDTGYDEPDVDAADDALSVIGLTDPQCLISQVVLYAGPPLCYTVGRSVIGNRKVLPLHESNRLNLKDFPRQIARTLRLLVDLG